MAEIKYIQSQIPILPQRKKVAAYARVSKDTDQLMHSLSAQVSYYNDLIQRTPQWEYAGVYVDAGLTGTSATARPEFQRLIADCEGGKINLVLTKSIFDSKGELLLTIMSSLAQEESRSISENVRWGQRKKINDGRFSLNYKHFLGYDKGPDGGLVVNPEQAKIVRRIYGEFLEGKSPFAIARGLTEDGIPSPAGKPRWNDLTIKRVLSNETYKGDKLLQKTYSNDFLDKTRRKNEGQVPQVYVEGCHEAIIPPETFKQVQIEIERRKQGRNHGAGVFSAKIYCGDCGQQYGPKVWHSNDPRYRKTIWQCNGKFKNHTHCKTPHLTEDEIKEAFVRAINKLLKIRKEVIANLRDIQAALDGTEALKNSIAQLEEERNVVAQIVQQLIEQNARVVQDQADYQRRYIELMERYESISSLIDTLTPQSKLWHFQCTRPWERVPRAILPPHRAQTVLPWMG